MQPAADAKHFLGAIVVQAQEPILGGLQASSIIDGQQRSTTLQLLMDATAATLEAASHDPLAGQLDRLTHNEDIYVPDAATRLKVRHSNRNRAVRRGDGCRGTRRSRSASSLRRAGRASAQVLHGSRGGVVERRR